MFKFAFRNLKRNKRRTLIALSSIIFSGLLVSFARFLAYGSHQETIYSAVQLSTGYLQVQAYGYAENPVLERALDVPGDLFSLIETTAGKKISPRIEGSGLVAHKQFSQFVQVTAANFERESKVTIIHDKVVNGKWPGSSIELSSEKINIYEAAIGTALARKLKAKIGTVISLSGGQFDGSAGAVLLKVSGIFETYDTQLNQGMLYIPLSAGAAIFAPNDSETMTPRFTSLVVPAKDVREAERIYEKIKNVLPEIDEAKDPGSSDYYGPVAVFWPELIPGLVQLVAIDKISGELSLAFVILIMSFGILNNVQMSILERKREFGILLAIGTLPQQIMKLVVLESMLLFFIGLILGFFAGIAISGYLEVNPIVFTGDNAKAFTESGFAPVLRCVVDAEQLWLAFLSLFLPTVIFTFFAVRKISSIEPVTAINEGLT